MNKVMIAIMFGIVLISLASAKTIYSGDTIYYDFTDEVDVIQSITWEVVNNTYDLEGLNITTNLTGAIMSIDPLFKPDNFTIIFNITGKNEVPKDCPSCGGGGTRYKDRDIIIEKEVEKIVYVNQTEEEPIDLIPEEEPKISLIMLILLSVGVIILIILIIKTIKRIKNKSNELNGNGRKK